MSGTDPLGALDVEVVGQIVRRASSAGFEEWWGRVRASGHCARPIRLRRREAGVTTSVYARCKDGRAARCPSCSALYAGDTWHLVHAGLAGGEGIPASVGEHPAVFATLTAPSFGAVHSAVAGTTCRPERSGGCVHHRSSGCRLKHGGGDRIVGQALCADCYDYLGQALFTWHAPGLWHRFTIELRRLVHRRAGGALRVSFVKVMEMQARAVPHFHAIIRLDAAGEAGLAERPDADVDASALAELVVRAADRVHLEVPSDGGELRSMRFGPHIDVQPIAVARGDDEPERVRAMAGYLAK